MGPTQSGERPVENLSRDIKNEASKPATSAPEVPATEEKPAAEAPETAPVASPEEAPPEPANEDPKLDEAVDDIAAFSELDEATLNQATKCYSSGMLARLTFSISFSRNSAIV